MPVALRTAAAREQGNGSPVREATMDTVITQFLNQVEGRNGRPFSRNTLAAYRRDLAQFRSFVAEHGAASWDIEPATLLEFRQWLRERDLALASQARKLAAVKSFFGYLTREGIIPSNPAAALTGPQVDHAPPQTVAAADLRALLAAAGDGAGPEASRDRAMLALLCTTGLRASEMVALDVDHLDWDTRTVTCVRSRRQDTQLQFDDDVAAALRVYLDAGRPRLAQTPAETALFLNHRGGRLSRQGFWLIVKAIARAAGVEAVVNPRTLRHTAATGMVRRSQDLTQVQADLGHASPTSTRVYAQMAGRQEAAASEATAELAG